MLAYDAPIVARKYCCQTTHIADPRLAQGQSYALAAAARYSNLLRPDVFDAFAICDGNNTVFPQCAEQAVRRTFPIKDDDEPMQEGIVVSSFAVGVRGTLASRSGAMSLTRLSARPSVTAFEITKNRRPMASFTQ